MLTQLTTLVTYLKARLDTADDRGAPLVEYGALIGIIGVVVLALAAMGEGIGQQIGGLISTAINTVFGNSSGGGG